MTVIITAIFLKTSRHEVINSSQPSQPRFKRSMFMHFSLMLMCILSESPAGQDAEALWTILLISVFSVYGKLVRGSCSKITQICPFLLIISFDLLKSFRYSTSKDKHFGRKKVDYIFTPF